MSAPSDYGSFCRILLLSAASAALLTACAQEVEKPTERAVQQAPKAISLQPYIQSAANESEQKRDYSAAASYWGMLFRTDPENIQAGLEYARNMRYAGSANDAVRFLEQLRRVRRDDPEIEIEYGKALVAAERAEDGLLALEHAASLAPGDWSALSAQGVALDMIGRYAEARQKYEAALALAPNHPKIMNNLALNMALRGEIEEATQLLREASQRPEANMQVRQNLALVLGLQGRFREAERIAKADLPEEMAEKNVAYYRGLLAEPDRWQELREIDRR